MQKKTTLIPAMLLALGPLLGALAMSAHSQETKTVSQFSPDQLADRSLLRRANVKS